METQKPEDDDYIPLSEAAKLMHYSARHLKRFIKDGKLEAVRANQSLIKVSKASIKAYQAQYGERLVDPMEMLKERVSRLEQALGDALRQIAEQNAEIGDLKATHHRRIAELVEQLHQLAVQRTQKTTGKSPTERRGLPADWERLTIFAKNHDVRESIVRALVKYDSTLVSLVKRPTATTYRYEWWFSGEQQARLLATLRTQDIAYIPCPNCPHNSERKITAD
jgi:excinuclease UvrABC nuclease subunit